MGEVTPTKQFISAIRSELEKGYGFIPLIGSGFSVSSGIPTGEQIGEYLCYCLERALEDLWKPSELKWPQFHEARGKNWVDLAREVLEKIKKEGLLTEKPDLLKLEGLGSLASWRTTLQFISRLYSSEGNEVELGTPDYRIVDSFFLHVTHGRHPGVNHMMLAHLASPLRTETILTTNFDSLIEEAFLRIGMPLATFDVHQRARLPHARHVLEQRSIIKLHGGRYGLRADFSLDEKPKAEEMETFAGYFNQCLRTVNKTKKHLLVFGVSGHDKRTVALIQSVIKKIPDLNIYWSCYRQEENERIHTLFDREADSNRSGKLIVGVHQDLGAFLLELYQRQCLSLPPAGADYPALRRAPPVPREMKLPIFDKKKDILCKFIKGLIKAGQKKKNNVPPILVVDGLTGMTSLCAQVYYDLCYDLCDEYNCVWLDLDDFMDHQEVLIATLDALAWKLDDSAFEPLYSTGNDVNCIKGKLGASDRSFVVFLNGRDGPGKNAGLIPKHWSDDEQIELYKALAKLRQPNILFVVMAAEKQIQKMTKKELFESKDSCGKHDFFCKSWKRKGAFIVFDAVEAIKKVIKHLNLPWQIRFVYALKGFIKSQKNLQENKPIPWQIRFVYALTLFRHPRHPAALCSWALSGPPDRLRNDGKDNDYERATRGDKLLLELEKTGAISDKLGGGICIHRYVREPLREELVKKWPELKKIRAECHQGIADWYVKLFRSSNDPLAVFESLYHRLQCMEFAHESNKNLVEQVHFIDTCFAEMIATLRLANPQMLSCGYSGTPNNIIGQVETAVKEKPSSDHKRKLVKTCREFKFEFLTVTTNYTKALEELGDSNSGGDE